MKSAYRLTLLNSRLLSRGLIACAMLALFTSFLGAQDFEAVEKRLGEAVAEGELSLKQAAIMMEALKHSAKGGDPATHHANQGDNVEAQVAHWIESVAKDLKSAVDSDKMSEEVARQKWQYFKEQELGPKLKAAVKSGVLSEDFAMAMWKKWEGGEKKEGVDEANRKTENHGAPDWEAIKSHIEGAVKAGKMTRAEANEAYERIKRKTAAGQ